jgi:hypothetical protein
VRWSMYVRCAFVVLQSAGRATVKGAGTTVNRAGRNAARAAVNS